jgi:polysaccharide deacetylase family protein (PEP-CTERM system associated)
VKSIFSVDVEDWFHILGVPTAPVLTEWDRLPSRIETNFMRLLDIFGEKNVQVTCFFLGWVAEKHPDLVKEAARRGHEIASHGYSHRLAYEMTPEEFSEDVIKTREILEDLIGRSVLGFRSAGVSATEATPWFFDRLMAAGYVYDSSVFPASHGHGGLKAAAQAPYVVAGGAEPFYEFPISVVTVLGRPVCFFGGGYLRFFPYLIIRKMARKVLSEGRPVVFYIHPREIDPQQPRLQMPVVRRFKSYVNLNTAEAKMMNILDDFEITTFERFLKEDADLVEVR